MRFEWDDEKNQTNIRKHKVSFEQAQTIFGGIIWTTIDQRFDYGETRLISIGLLEETVIIVVVHTGRDGTIRIISARVANRRERKRYYEEIRKASSR